MFFLSVILAICILGIISLILSIFKRLAKSMLSDSVKTAQDDKTARDIQEVMMNCRPIEVGDRFIDGMMCRLWHPGTDTQTLKFYFLEKYNEFEEVYKANPSEDNRLILYKISYNMCLAEALDKLSQALDLGLEINEVKVIVGCACPSDLPHDVEVPIIEFLKNVGSYAPCCYSCENPRTFFCDVI